MNISRHHAILGILTGFVLLIMAAQSVGTVSLESGRSEAVSQAAEVNPGVVLGAQEAEQENQQYQSTLQKQVTTDTFEARNLLAETVLVIDAQSHDVLYAKADTLKRPLASLTKIMSAVIAAESAPLETLIEITPESMLQGGDHDLRPGEQWELGELLEYTLITSCNDCAYAVQSEISRRINRDTEAHPAVNSFVQAMNNKARELGMRDTFFLNATGFDIGDSLSGSYGTAWDMVDLFQYTLENFPEMMTSTVLTDAPYASIDGVERRAENTNVALHKLPGIVAHKTGFTDLALGNIVFAIEPTPGEQYIVVIMGSGFAERFDDAVAITETIYELRESLVIE